MTDDTTRHAFIHGLRELAAFIESHPDMPTPSCKVFNIYMGTAEEFRRVAQLLGSVDKDAGDTWFALRKTFGSGTIHLDLFTERDKVCTREVVGTREVPEQIIPAHREEIVEWKCNSILEESSHAAYLD